MSGTDVSSGSGYVEAAGSARAAFANLRMGIGVFGPDGALVLNNPCFVELLGIAPEHALAGTPAQAVLQSAAVAGSTAALPRHGPAHPPSVRLERPDGRVLDVHSDPLPDGGFSLTIRDISTLARAEQDALSRAMLLDTVLRQVPHGICVYGPDGRVALVNGAYARIMSGVPVAVGDPLETILLRRAEAGEYGPGDPAGHVSIQLAQFLEHPQILRRTRPDGRTIDIRTATLPDGGHLSVIADVSTLMDAQAEIAGSAALMASIVEHIPHGVTVYGPDRTLQLVNAAYGRIMGGAPIEIGDTIEAITERRARTGEYGPGDPDELIQFQRAHDSRKPQYRRRQRPNGNVIDVRTAPLPDGGHISVVTDVTPLVAAEAELQRRAETMDAMLANIRHGIVLWDAEHRIVAANGVAADLLLAPPGMLVPGRALAESVASALARGNLGHGAAAEARARYLLEEDRSQSHEDQRLTRDGRVLEVRSDPTPQGGFVTTYTDVTRIREAEDALRLAKSAAESANAAKSRFLAAMSTELRTPITAILNEFATVSRDAADLRTRQVPGLDPLRLQRSAEAGAASARQLLALIDTILDVARVEAGRFDLADDTVAIPALVGDCLRQFDNAAAAAEVALLVELPDGLPGLRADQRRLRQALGHIVGNAVKFTSPGTVSIGATVDAATGDMVLHVQDTGIGIAAADLERVFEPFTQAEPPDAVRRRPGAGLGLYIARTVLRAHGGDVVLHSAPGRGTTAELRLPASRVPQGRAPEPT